MLPECAPNVKGPSVPSLLPAALTSYIAVFQIAVIITWCCKDLSFLWFCGVLGGLLEVWVGWHKLCGKHPTCLHLFPLKWNQEFFLQCSHTLTGSLSESITSQREIKKLLNTFVHTEEGVCNMTLINNPYLHLAQSVKEGSHSGLTPTESSQFKRSSWWIYEDNYILFI